ARVHQAFLGLQEVSQVLRIDLLRRFQDILQNFRALVLFADLIQVRADFGAFAADAMAIAALDAQRFEEQLSAALDVAGDRQNLLRLDDIAEPLYTLVFGQEALEEIADIGVLQLRSAGHRGVADLCRHSVHSVDQLKGRARRSQQWLQPLLQNLVRNAVRGTELLQARPDS